MHQLAAAVINNERVADEHFLLTLHAPQIAEAAQPGQFVHVRVGQTYDPLLRRPFSILRADRSAGLIWILLKVVGRGTKLLAQVGPGSQLDLIGPLGNVFPTPTAARGDVILCAGGVGVAPIIFLADHFQEHCRGIHIVSIFGAASDGALACWLELAARSDEFYVTTEDGCAGEQGLATDLLARYLTERSFAAVYACGPRPMLAAAAHLCAKAGVPCFVSLEQFMGCGVGACLGCAVPAAVGGYVRVCTDGPVFSASAIDWEALLRQWAPG
ncbi:MAG: dihydroorotate dehydrogenase electron transfer subunit [Armatimonadetes bacterium]|nr:dihydroorotate dehydrogenase electron transfer subunit [Armatimonadota bacterium]